MGINFDKAPDTNPYGLIPEGIYRFEIVKAELKPPANKDKKAYINMQIKLFDGANNKKGTLFDKIFDSDAPALLYKLKRLVRAIKVPLSGEVELKDLAKILPGKKGTLEVTQQPDSRFPDDRTKDQAAVKLFGSECFWTWEEYAGLVATDSDTVPAEEEEMPFSVEAETVELDDGTVGDEY